MWGHTSSHSSADLYVMTLSGLVAFCSLGTYGRSLWRMASTRASTWSSPTTLAHSLHRPTRRLLESRTCTRTNKTASSKRSWLGHWRCMTDDTLPKKLLLCPVEGNRCPGCGRKGWHEIVQSDALGHISTCYCC